MISIEAIFHSIEAAYRRTEKKLLSLSIEQNKREKVVSQCMALFQPLYLDQSTTVGLEAYFRYLIHDKESISDVPFNFLLQEDEKADLIIAAILQALQIITGEEQASRSVDEEQLLTHYEEELTELGNCSVYIIRNCHEAPMTAEERFAWNITAGLFELTPRITKILCAPKQVIDTRFRDVDHIYYRVFRNSIRTRRARSDEMYDALLSVLKERKFYCSLEFLEEIRLYIDTVYPKADLKEAKFVSDLVERVVHRYYEKNRTGLQLDAECVPYYRRPTAAVGQNGSEDSTAIPPQEEPAQAKPQSTATEEPLPPGAPEPVVDDYTVETTRPIVKNVLVVALSTFPISKKLNKCTYTYGQEQGEYYYQQEPFPMRLRDALKDAGEILMLTTPETRIATAASKDGSELATSPQAYFMDAVRAIDGMEHILFKSVEVNDEDSTQGVSEVVGHLRELKGNNAKQGKGAPRIYVGTNGGLRGLQLILEAVLSLLTLDGITVKADQVWSIRPMKKGGPNSYELFNSAAEFRIFDFVSGINEFLNYGRVDSLVRFMNANPELKDEASIRLLDCIKDISKGIQFCDINAFQQGLKQLSVLKESDLSSSNRYIELFRKNIMDDYKPLLAADHSALDEIEWCIKKGFYQQAFALAEGALPREYLHDKMISYDEGVFDAANLFKNERENAENYLFNHSVVWLIDRIYPEGGQETNQRAILRIWKNDRGDQAEIKTSINSADSVAQLSDELKLVLRSHNIIKRDRNELFHIDERHEKTPSEYQADLKEYVRLVRDFRKHWAGKKHPPLIRITSMSPANSAADNAKGKKATKQEEAPASPKSAVQKKQPATTAKAALGSAVTGKDSKAQVKTQTAQEPKAVSAPAIVIDMQKVSDVLIVGDMKPSKARKRLEDATGKTGLNVRKVDGYENPILYAKGGEEESNKDKHIGLLFDRLSKSTSSRSNTLILVGDSWIDISPDLLSLLQAKGYQALVYKKDAEKGIVIENLRIEQTS